MRRNMQEVLERWGRWAAREEYCSLVDWPTLSVIPQYSLTRSKPGCTDEDGAAIDTCIAHMGTVCRSDDMLILGQRFIGGHSLRQIAEVQDMRKDSVNASLRASEAFLEGCLVMLGIRLDMDTEVMLPTEVTPRQKPILLF